MALVVCACDSGASTVDGGSGKGGSAAGGAAGTDSGGAGGGAGGRAGSAGTDGAGAGGTSGRGGSSAAGGVGGGLGGRGGAAGGIGGRGGSSAGGGAGGQGGGIACGQTTCVRGQSICVFSSGGAGTRGGSPYNCRDIPAACGSQPTCDCLCAEMCRPIGTFDPCMCTDPSTGLICILG